MKQIIACFLLLGFSFLNIQCGTEESAKTEEPNPEPDTTATTTDMTNPFNFETKTVLLNSGYEMPILGIGTFMLSNSQAEASVYNALKVGMRLIDTADIYGN